VGFLIVAQVGAQEAVEPQKLEDLFSAQRVLVLNSAGSSGTFQFSYRYPNQTSISMLSESNVRKDLELVEEQMKQIDKINQEFARRIVERRKALEAARSAKDKSHERISVEIENLRKEREQALSEVLLPHQAKRIEQLFQQVNLKRSGTAVALQRGELSKLLGITAEQKKDIQNLQQEMNKEIKEKVEELKQKYARKMRQKLTPEQRRKYEELVGEVMKKEPTEREKSVDRRNPGSGD
jgi:predicted transglutaminase-like cysteine proteinase